MVGTGMSRGAERERIWCNCGLGDGGRRSEDVDTDANVEKLLGDSLEGGFGGGEGGRSPWGCGRSSGIGILLRCTVRLDGGLYAFGGSSNLMRCSLAEGWVSYITYWCSSSDKLPVATSAEIIRNEHSTGWGDSRELPRLCLRRFTCSTTWRTLGTSADEAERTVMNSIASCRGGFKYQLLGLWGHRV